ncbi:hypothetical protein FMEXI_4193 [Fusarium mexicanum]|uniref:Uncharacterized protein n=1 Tax=Fusarium mexicanum TaxID=751941 RepID=A0A8H5J611_9HYPO|nr:hypothetical protein FMEXI_4193 [Fusarium mexicanum]
MTTRGDLIPIPSSLMPYQPPYSVDLTEKDGDRRPDDSRCPSDPAAPTFPTVPTQWLVRFIENKDTIQPAAARERVQNLTAWVGESNGVQKLDDLNADVGLQVDVSPFVSTTDGKETSVAAQAEAFIGIKTPVGDWKEMEKDKEKNQEDPDALKLLRNFGLFYYEDESVRGLYLTACTANYYVISWSAVKRDDLVAGPKLSPSLTRKDRLDQPLLTVKLTETKWTGSRRVQKLARVREPHSLHSTLRLAVGTTPLTALTKYAQAHVQLSDPKQKDATQRQLELWLKKLETLLLARNDGIESQQQVANLLYNWNFVCADDGEAWHASSDSDGRGSAQRASEGLIQHLRMMKRSQQLLEGVKRTLASLERELLFEWWRVFIKSNPQLASPKGLAYHQGVRIQLFLQNGTFYREVRLPGRDGTQSLPTLLPFESPSEDPGLRKKPTREHVQLQLPVARFQDEAFLQVFSSFSNALIGQPLALAHTGDPSACRLWCAFYISPENDDGDRFTALKPFTYIRRGKLELAVGGVLLDPFSRIPTDSGIPLVRELVLPSWTCQSAQANIKAFFHLGPLVVTKHIPPAIAPVRGLRLETPAVLPDVDYTSGVGTVTLLDLGNGDWAWLQPFYPASKDAAGAEEEDSNSDETNGEPSVCSSSGTYTALPVKAEDEHRPSHVDNNSAAMSSNMRIDRSSKTGRGATYRECSAHWRETSRGSGHLEFEDAVIPGDDVCRGSGADSRSGPSALVAEVVGVDLSTLPVLSEV